MPPREKKNSRDHGRRGPDRPKRHDVVGDATAMEANYGQCSCKVFLQVAPGAEPFQMTSLLSGGRAEPMRAQRALGRNRDAARAMETALNPLGDGSRESGVNPSGRCQRDPPAVKARRVETRQASSRRLQTGVRLYVSKSRWATKQLPVSRSGPRDTMSRPIPCHGWQGNL